jgi:hypothetical protein
VRALAIGATTAGRVRSQARATAATVVLRAAAIPSSAARIRSPLSSRYCAAVEARWLSTFAPGRYLPARKIGTDRYQVSHSIHYAVDIGSRA